MIRVNQTHPGHCILWYLPTFGLFKRITMDPFIRQSQHAMHLSTVGWWLTKYRLLHMELIQNDLNVCVLTETWIKEDNNLTVHQICSSGYKAISVPMKVRTGGGITVVYRNIYQVKTLTKHVFVNMEPADFKVTICNRSIVLKVIYIPHKTNECHLQEISLISWNATLE